MGQFDLETDAALAQLNFEEISKTPGGEFAEIIGDLLALTGIAGPIAFSGAASNLLLKIRALAGASYTSNLIYAITATRNDLADLYSKHAELRGRIDDLTTDPRFAEAIAALALRAMHTSVKDRLKRLARIVVNGVKEDDLELESLDDMMRAVVELEARDIAALGLVYVRQSGILAKHIKMGTNASISLWQEEVRKDWQTAGFDVGVAIQKAGSNDFDYRSSLTKLAGLGFVTTIPPVETVNSPGRDPYALLPRGKKFYERLQEIGTAK